MGYFLFFLTCSIVQESEDTWYAKTTSELFRETIRINQAVKVIESRAHTHTVIRTHSYSYFNEIYGNKNYY